MKTIYLILFVLLMFPNILMAVETDSLWVGNMTIKIGMDKNQVISTLTEHFDVVQDKIKSEDPAWENWSIYKKSDKRKVEDFVGSLGFKKNKVESVMKSWGGFGGKEVASLGQELVGVLSKFIEAGKTSVNIQIHETKEPGISLKSIAFISGNHSVTIIVSNDGINMQEDISK